MSNNKDKKVCSICKKPYTGHGNNAYPLAKGKCCNRCNGMVVGARVRTILGLD